MSSARQDASLAHPQARPLDRRAPHRFDLCNAAGRDHALDGRGYGRGGGVSVSSVQRIWRAHGLQPHRIRHSTHLTLCGARSRPQVLLKSQIQR